MRNLILFLLILSIIEGGVHAQSITPQTINIAGGTYYHGYYSIDWSIGELALVNQLQSSDATTIVSNGLIQPLTDRFNTVNYSQAFLADEIRILPNPTYDILEVNYLSFMRGPVVFKLYDVQGRLLYARSTNSYGFGFIERINMTGFASGTYMLHISVNSIDPGAFKKSGVYKILKV